MRRAERRVVHRRRDRVADRRADQAVHLRRLARCCRKRYSSASSAGVSWPTVREAAGVGPASSRTGRRARASRAPCGPMPISTSPLCRPACEPSSSSGRQSQRHGGLRRRPSRPRRRSRASPARAPRDRPARPSKSCDESTMRRPPLRSTRSPKRARHSMSTYSAPSASASASSACRSSSDPAKLPAFPRRPARDDDRPAPPGERAGDARIARPSRAAARPGRRPTTVVAPARSSAVVGAVTVTQSRGFDTAVSLSLRPGTRPWSPNKKASSTVRLKRLGNSVARWQVRPRRMPLQESPDTTTTRTTPRPPGPASASARVEVRGARPAMNETATISNGVRRCQPDGPFLLDQQALLPYNGNLIP